jgi:hypothetical protein
MKKTLLTLISFCAIGLVANAQSWDDQTWDNSGDSWDNSGNSGGDDSKKTNDKSKDYDYGQASGSTVIDSNAADAWGSDDSWGDAGSFDYGTGGQEYVRSARPDAVAKPYERFSGMPFDSASRLITFFEVVEVIVPDRFLDLGGQDYSVADSLYARAIAWMEKEFGKREAKQMIDAAGADSKGREGQTIKAYIVMPLVVEVNKYQKSTVGVIEFVMELRFKDERYRYKFDNFIHVTPNSTGGRDDEETYMEYYMTAKKDPRGNDKILMACNSQMNRLIGDLKASCSATPFVDDDDW